MSPSERFDLSGMPHHTADVAAIFKDRTRQKSGTAMAVLAVADPTPLELHEYKGPLDMLT